MGVVVPPGTKVEGRKGGKRGCQEEYCPTAQLASMGTLDPTNCTLQFNFEYTKELYTNLGEASFPENF